MPQPNAQEFPDSSPDQSPAQRARRAGVVLIVDDQQDAREMYATYFNHSGFSAHTASDGSIAVGMAVALKPDVIVMDLTMPVLDGISATQQIRKHPRTSNVPIVLLTGYSQKAVERGALESGVDVFLTKPCLPEDLERHVRWLMESKRQPR